MTPYHVETSGNVMQSKAEKFPVLIKRGSVTVKIYAGKNRGKAFFTLTWVEANGRRRETFMDLGEARREGAAKAEALAKGDIDALKLTGSERAHFVAARDALALCGIAVDVAAREYAEAVKILGGSSRLLDAARFYMKQVALNVVDFTVCEAYEKYRTAKKQEGFSTLYLKDIDGPLGRFAKAFQCPLREVTADEIRAYLDGLGVGLVTWNNHLRLIKGFFSHAKLHNWLDQTRTTAADAIDPRRFQKGKKPRKPVYTPEEMEKLLAAAPVRFLPHIILVGFCGLRHDEITEELLPRTDDGKRKRRPEAKGQLCWEHIDFDEGAIVVPAHIAKTEKERKIKLQPNVLEWLAPYRGRTGHIYSIATRRDREATAKAAGLKWKNNALRHSFCSYALEITDDAAKVSRWAGNSPQVLQDEYAKTVTAVAAAKYWSIRPIPVGNVISIASAA
jgi:integrase